LSGEHGNRMQRIWWSRNGKHFPLMCLPRELRALIYRHALETYVYPQENLGTIKHVRPSDGDFCREAGRQASEAPNYSLLRVSKQVYAEAKAAPWRGTPKHFVCPQQTEDVIINANVGPAYNWLTKLHLNFSLDDHYDFLGIKIEPFLHIRSQDSRSALLKSISNLEEVEFFFR
ncbi:hypothetical protein BU23DRAFT_406350, partial [Bimuria novae-zelandiae CBS 107.79]